MKPGDKVICVDDRNWYSIPVRCICAGLIYTLTEVFQCKCGNIYVRLAEVDKPFHMWCAKCDVTTYTTMFFHIERFRPLEEEEYSERQHYIKKVPVVNPN
jgi:hypothetical protein